VGVLAVLDPGTEDIHDIESAREKESHQLGSNQRLMMYLYLASTTPTHEWHGVRLPFAVLFGGCTQAACPHSVELVALLVLPASSHVTICLETASS